MFGVYRLEGWGIIVNAYIQRLVDLLGGVGYNCQHFFRVPFWVFVCVRGDMWDGGLGYNCLHGLERRRWGKGLGLFRRAGAWVVPARGGLDFLVFGGEGLEGDSGGGG